jgi:hypothetical protein
LEIFFANPSDIQNVNFNTIEVITQDNQNQNVDLRNTVDRLQQQALGNPAHKDGDFLQIFLLPIIGACKGRTINIKFNTVDYIDW